MIEEIMAAELSVVFGKWKVPPDAAIQEISRKFLERILPMHYEAVVDIYQNPTDQSLDYEVTLEKI